MPTKKITSSLAGFQEEFNTSVSLFKKEGVLDISDYDFKKHQFDAEDIMKKYNTEIHKTNMEKYDKLFNPIARLERHYSNDPYLNNDASFYRVISQGELINLIKTKKNKRIN